MAKNTEYYMSKGLDTDGIKASIIRLLEEL